MNWNNAFATLFFIVILNVMKHFFGYESAIVGGMASIFYQLLNKADKQD